MGILAMYDRRVAFEKTILIKETLKIDQRLRVCCFCNNNSLKNLGAKKLLAIAKGVQVEIIQ